MISSQPRRPDPASKRASLCKPPGGGAPFHRNQKHHAMKIEPLSTTDVFPYTLEDRPHAYVLAFATDEQRDAMIAAHSACIGLEIPPDIAPGALAALLADCQAAWGRAHPALEDLRAALAPFTEDPAPVNSQGVRNGEPIPLPPIGYAVKTPAGYIANQGNEWCHEAEPVGWALFSTRESAESIALHRNGGEIVPVYRD